MSFFSDRRIRRRKDGSFDVRFSSDEREILEHFLVQLRDLLLSDDPLLKRLFPPAYLADPERDRDYQDLMKGDLLESKFAAIETVEETLQNDSLDEAQLTQWMQATNSLRLVIGTRLDVPEEMPPPDPDDPDFPLRQIYEVLTWVLSDITTALTEALPEPTGDANAPER